MPENDTHELVVIEPRDWDTYVWVCSCGAESAVRWSSASYARRNHAVHKDHEED